VNEFDFIRQLREQVGSRENSPRLSSGIGDDAAVIRQSSGRDLVITTDLLVEDVDFYRESTPARLLGHKALAVSLSDIAAMGARPAWSLISIGLPKKEWSSNFKDELFKGYLELAGRFGVTLAGGDVSQSHQVILDSIVVGEAQSGRAVLRSTARAGDQIFVTGTLGGAAAGLKLLKLGARVSEPPATGVPSAAAGVGWSLADGPDQAQSADSSTQDADNQTSRSDEMAIQSLLLCQLSPQPRVGWGIVLGEDQLATSMIDISDGLSSDLHHLCNESNVGAVIDAAALPLDRNVKQLCGRRKLDPLALALHGGEDFELLFTVAPENISRLPKAVDGVTISRTGEIIATPGKVRVSEKGREWDLTPQGFQHFSDSNAG
jgi:thiamine-monophosphate kinase